jgi:uncharacterized damage-inducible protein DinB
MNSEVKDYLMELGIIRQQIIESVRGLNDEAMNWQPLSGETNSIYAILSHLIGAQNNWVRKIISGQEIRRDREAEFKASGIAVEIIDSFEKESRALEEILRGLSLAKLDEKRSVPGQSQVTASVRWCILHVISHNAVHLGHMQLTRQLWEKRTH